MNSTNAKIPSKHEVLEKLLLLEKEKRKLGLIWKDHYQLIEKISNICQSISEVIDLSGQRHLLEERLGELILTSFSFCIFCQFCPIETTEKTLLKFHKRLEGVMQLATKDGYLNLNNRPIEVILSYWREAKKLDSSSIALQSKQPEVKAVIFEKAVFVEKQARAFGFKWDNYQRLIEKIHDECQEISEAIERSYMPESLQEELGDLILASLSFCMYCDFDPRETIEKSLNDLEKTRHTSSLFQNVI
ncbi:MAG: hypothetical protein K2W94_08615 [Alphaproteobacteria bacterium]|nr:hypothetical protein [Alphaproteobacteria bacterium]